MNSQTKSLSQRAIRHLMVQSLRIIEHEQLTTGEIQCLGYKPVEGRFNCPFPLFSALTYDALGYLDSVSDCYVHRTMDGFSGVQRRFLATCITTIRWRLRTYIASEEESDGTWSRFGRTGVRCPDASTSAHAAAALLKRTSDPRATDRAEPLKRMIETGSCEDWAVPDVLRFLALAGEPRRGLVDHVRQILKDQMSPDLRLVCAVASASHYDDFPNLQDASSLRTRLVATLAEAATDSCPLNAALATAGLIDMDENQLAKECLNENISRGLNSGLLDVGHSDSVYGIDSAGTVAAVNLSNVMRSLATVHSGAG